VLEYRVHQILPRCPHVIKPNVGKNKQSRRKGRIWGRSGRGFLEGELTGLKVSPRPSRSGSSSMATCGFAGAADAGRWAGCGEWVFFFWGEVGNELGHGRARMGWFLGHKGPFSGDVVHQWIGLGWVLEMEWTSPCAFFLPFSQNEALSGWSLLTAHYGLHSIVRPPEGNTGWVSLTRPCLALAY
jgi:hypothetical protein